MAVNFGYEVSLSYSTGSFSCRKILRHGTSGFSFLPKEVMLGSLTLKIHHRLPGVNPRVLGPVASTVMTRPPSATFRTILVTVLSEMCSGLMRLVGRGFRTRVIDLFITG
jgi:hypothetical protein